MYRDIAIHLTGSMEDDVRIGMAVRLAATFDAHLSGLQLFKQPEVLSMTDPTGSAYLKDLLAAATDEAQRISTRLSLSLDRTGVPSSLRRIDAFPATAGEALAAEARLSDLIILTRPYGDPAREHAIEESVLFRSGRPCLFLPPKEAGPGVFDRIYVAWKNTREATLALAAALPLLHRARSVVVGLVDEDAEGTAGPAAGDDIGRYLSRHGIRAELRSPAARSSVGATLLEDAWSVEAQLLVMGGYGHSRMREFLIGGVTRHVLEHAPIPVFSAH